MYARSTTVLAHTGSIDAGVARVRDEVMPALAATDGRLGLSMLCDRAAAETARPPRLDRSSSCP